MRDILGLLRPRQWVKNAFVLAPLVFSHRFLEAEATVAAGLGFIAFCLASSSCYVLNDILDAERDRQHPRKQRRPIAAGRISPEQGWVLSGILAAGAIALGLVVGWRFAACAAGYLLLQVGYSTTFKNFVLLDAVSIATGFVLRVAGGVVAIDARMSGWLFTCTFLLALFLALAKRRQELLLLRQEAAAHRDVLEHYTDFPLDTVIAVVAGATILVYIQYTLSAEVAEKLGTTRLYLTVPFVVFGVFRYLLLVYRHEQGGNPTDVLLGDRLLQMTIALWVLTVVVLLYA